MPDMWDGLDWFGPHEAGGMGDPGRRGSRSAAQPAARRAPARNRQRTDEGEAAKKLLASIDGLEFNELDMAINLTTGSEALQPRLMSIFIEWARVWSEVYDSGMIDDLHPMFNTAVKAKQITETLDNMR